MKKDPAEERVVPHADPQENPAEAAVQVRELLCSRCTNRHLYFVHMQHV